MFEEAERASLELELSHTARLLEAAAASTHCREGAASSQCTEGRVSTHCTEGASTHWRVNLSTCRDLAVSAETLAQRIELTRVS